MAVRQRIFNSTAPFSGSPQTELKGSYTSCSAVDQKTEEVAEGKDGGVELACLNSLINKVITHGTAEQVGEMPFKSSSFIAQAECETQDSQEFSPSCSERSYVPSPNCFISLSSEPNNVAFPTTSSAPEPTQPGPRKKTRKRHKRKEKKKGEKKKEKLRDRRRLPSGVPEQESGSSLLPIQLDEPLESLGRRSSCSSSCSSSSDSSDGQPRGPSLFLPGVFSITGSGCPPSRWPDLPSVSPPDLESQTRGDEDDDYDSLSGLGECKLALAGLRGSVSQGDRCFAAAFFRDVELDAREEEEDEEGDELCGGGDASFCNEGIIFENENLQPVDSEYKEGSEYVLLKFIKEGSYGEVHTAQDVTTGFTFAIKKISLRRFNSEEVGAWSALRSPRVVELFGVVREGPNVVLLMDHKYGSLGQLIMQRGRLPEDLSLHYYGQILQALEHLVKKKVAHLDVKADNVLLSQDGKDAFLCDFGHAERLDNQGLSLSGSRDLKGTETHMAPEMVKGEPRGAKADVWSSCCALLHMLNGCPPWTRYYTCRLYLKIAHEPPPLREIPPDCGPMTAEVIKAGLQKDPLTRAPASELREKTAKALREVGGLQSPVRGPYTEPLYIDKNPRDSLQHIHSIVYSEDEDKSEDKPLVLDKMADFSSSDKHKKVNRDRESRQRPTICQQAPAYEADYRTSSFASTVAELERDFCLSSLSQPHSAEMQEQLLSCLSSDCYSGRDPWDKRDSGRWSLSPADDLSSGVFSCSSQPDVQVFSMDLLGYTHPTPPCGFEGVDVSTRDFNRRNARIRETQWVKVGHVATGPSEQISERALTSETPEGQHVGPDAEVQESGLELCCVSAPDYSNGWRWRIRDGVLETR